MKKKVIVMLEADIDETHPDGLKIALANETNPDAVDRMIAGSVKTLLDRENTKAQWAVVQLTNINQEASWVKL